MSENRIFSQVFRQLYKIQTLQTQPVLEHLKTGHVRFSDIYCNWVWKYLEQKYSSGLKNFLVASKVQTLRGRTQTGTQLASKTGWKRVRRRGKTVFCRAWVRVPAVRILLLTIVALRQRGRSRLCWWSPARARCTTCCVQPPQMSAQIKHLWSEFGLSTTAKFVFLFEDFYLKSCVWSGSLF